MAKKNFTTGLDSLFGASSNEEDLKKAIVYKDKTNESETAPKSKRRSKNFISDLDSLFQEAMQESVEEQMTAYHKRKTARTKRTTERRKNVLTGLDALIRDTVETSSIEFDANVEKRVTFTFEKQKLERLKSIAQVQKSYIKDIISEVLSEYIESYENKKKS